MGTGSGSISIEKKSCFFPQSQYPHIYEILMLYEICFLLFLENDFTFLITSKYIYYIRRKILRLLSISNTKI